MNSKLLSAIIVVAASGCVALALAWKPFAAVLGVVLMSALLLACWFVLAEIIETHRRG